MEAQENGSAAASLARERLLGATTALPTAEHVSLRQSSGQPLAVGTQIPPRPPCQSEIGSSSGFSSVNVEAAAALNCLSSYNEVVGKLNRLWDDQITVISNVDDNHWKNPEFPLARIKKIMRIDEDVKMISSEVPLMLSKAVEIFVMELSLRSWLHTEESKRRTVQRSDIAMAITKQDMFDFLIDIVPREEIQLKSKSQSKQPQSESDQLQLLTPELLQVYLQHVSQQQTTTTTTTSSTIQQQQQQPPPQTLTPLQQPQSSQQQQQQQQQEVITQQQHHQQQQQQQQLVDSLVGDMDEASAKIFQDNVALLQQLQQLVQLQVQVQQLQDATSASSTSDHTHSVGPGIHLPTSGALSLSHTPSHDSLASSVLNQPQQVMERSATDNIHRVTINAANDMLTDSELQSAITSLSSDGDTLRSASSLLNPLSSSPSSSFSSRLGRVTSMVIEPELVESGALANSPSPSSTHGLLDDADSAARILVRGREQPIPTPPLASTNSQGLPLQTQLSSVLNPQGPLRDPLSLSQQGRAQRAGGVASSAHFRQLHQLGQTETQISNILVQTGAEPEQYVVQTTPLMELVSSPHTVAINPSSAAVSHGNLTGIVRSVAGIPVAESNRSTSTLTPIGATPESSSQDTAFLSSLSSSTNPSMET